MGKKKVNYQSRIVRFPEKLYLFVMWIFASNGSKFIFPLHYLYKNPRKGLEEVQEIYKGLKKEGTYTHDWALVAPLHFIEKFPLKKDYWKNPSFEFEEFTRFRQFLSPMLNHKNYKLLVTPFNVQNKIFTAAMPFSNDVSLDNVDLFLTTSDWQVDQEADCAAFYSINGLVGIQIFTGETYHKDFIKNPEKKFVS